MEIYHLRLSPTAPLSPIPPWMFETPLVDLELHNLIKQKDRNTPECLIVQIHFERYEDCLAIFTDRYKDPLTGRTGAAIPNLSVYTAELVAILMGLKWAEENILQKIVIASDSQAAVLDIKSGKSCRADLVYNIYFVLWRLRKKEVSVTFLWVPVHIGIEENEDVDILAKQSLRSEKTELEIPICKMEGTAIINHKIMKTWQKYWDTHDTGIPSGKMLVSAVM